MCLITEQKRVKILKEDLTVYKIIYDSPWGLQAYIKRFYYKIGVVYEQKLGVDNIPDSYYGEEVVNVYNLDSSLFGSEHLTHVHEGFHFTTNPKRIKGHCSFSKKVYECTVPKGSHVYFDKTGLGVSNQIKIVRVL